MNNSAEAEKYLKDRKIKDEGLWETYSQENDPGYSGGGIRLSRLLSEFHNFAREKELSEITDEVIEGIVKIKASTQTLKALQYHQRVGAKKLRDHLKQNNTQSTSDLNEVFKAAIYELWMYSGGEDQSSEIRKKLEKYHEITGMPWPEGELKYKPK